MHSIGMAYRKYRHDVIMSKRQLNDLSPMPPLKAETVRRKSGAHTGGSFGKSTKNPAAQNLRVFKHKGIKAGATGRISMYPDTPLVDTGNMTAENALDLVANDGELTIRQGVSRAEIAAYHQFGMGDNPQRVHLSFNPEYVNGPFSDILVEWLNTTEAEGISEMKRVG